MSKSRALSAQTRRNWLIDAAVFAGAVGASVSGVYFLFSPVGFEGGRNPLYSASVLFNRQTWDDLHTWGGVVMIVAAVVHFAIHWDWVKMMVRRAVGALRGKVGSFSAGSKVNVAVDVIMAVSFVIAALSGLYFLLIAPAGGFQGGRSAAWEPGFLFSRTTWDTIHTWSGVSMIVAAVIHFYLHWRWVKNVTARVVCSLWPRRARESAPAARPR